MNARSPSMAGSGLPLAPPHGDAARLGAVALGAFLVSVMLAPLVASGPAQTDAQGGGNAVRQLVYLAIFAMALAAARAHRRPAVLLALPASLGLMLGWCGLSLLWAIDPGTAARRLVLTLIVAWTVFLLVATTGYATTVALVRWVLALVLAANWLAVLAVPSWAIHQAASEADPSIVGAWRGILVQKNFAGAACVLTILFFVYDAKHIRWLPRLAVVAASAGFLYHTNSRTSMILAASSLVLAGAYRLYRPYYRWAACLLLAFTLPLAGMLVHMYWDVLAEPLSRPDALTGRPLIWAVLWRYAQDHWLLGSGFGSFWNIGGPPPVAAYGHGWVASAIYSGHNGFLDVLVQTGVPGLVLAIVATVLAPLSTFLLHPALDRSRACLLLACIWFCVCHNLTESSLFDRDAIVHVFLMLAIALLCREARG